MVDIRLKVEGYPNTSQWFRNNRAEAIVERWFKK
jgi:hypothetical protein